MNLHRPTPTGVEVTFDPADIIVSKTDKRGIITYADRTFIEVSGYSEGELLGRPHSIIRHPEMPRCVFKLLWDTIQRGREIFAYVINLGKRGQHYWVFAHVTPDRDLRTGAITGYHSSRRLAAPEAIAEIRKLYAALLKEERAHSNKLDGMRASAALLEQLLAEEGVTYEQFVFDLYRRTEAGLPVAA